MIVQCIQIIVSKVSAKLVKKYVSHTCKRLTDNGTSDRNSVDSIGSYTVICRSKRELVIGTLITYYEAFAAVLEEGEFLMK